MPRADDVPEGAFELSASSHGYSAFSLVYISLSAYVRTALSTPFAALYHDHVSAAARQ